MGRRAGWPAVCTEFPDNLEVDAKIELENAGEATLGGNAAEVAARRVEVWPAEVGVVGGVQHVDREPRLDAFIGNDREDAFDLDVPVADAVFTKLFEPDGEHPDVVGAGLLGCATLEALEARRDGAGAAESDRGIEPLAEVGGAGFAGAEQVADVVDVAVEEAVAPVGGGAALALVDPAHIPVAEQPGAGAVLEEGAALAEGQFVDGGPGDAVGTNTVRNAFAGAGTQGVLGSFCDYVSSVHPANTSTLRAYNCLTSTLAVGFFTEEWHLFRLLILLFLPFFSGYRRIASWLWR